MSLRIVRVLSDIVCAREIRKVGEFVQNRRRLRTTSQIALYGIFLQPKRDWAQIHLTLRRATSVHPRHRSTPRTSPLRGLALVDETISYRRRDQVLIGVRVRLTVVREGDFAHLGRTTVVLVVGRGTDPCKSCTKRVPLIRARRRATKPSIDRRLTRRRLLLHTVQHIGTELILEPVCVDELRSLRARALAGDLECFIFPWLRPLRLGLSTSTARHRTERRDLRAVSRELRATRGLSTRRPSCLISGYVGALIVPVRNTAVR